MKDNYISYYELLTMVKKDNIPPKIILHLVPNKSVEYISYYDYADSEFFGYKILKDEKADENYSYHLGDCFLESTMFDKVIEIIEEEKEIEKIDNEHDFYCYTRYDSFKNDIDKVLYLINGINATNDRITDTNLKLNELIDEVKKLKEE